MKLTEEAVKNKIVFLGTAGARYAAFGLIRQAGGMWINIEGTNLHIDPGPGAFIYTHKKGLNPHWLSAIIVSHRHLDHCADVNHVIETITLGGKRKKGILLCPEDAISEDPVVLKFTRNNLQEIVIIKERLSKEIENANVSFPIKHVHGVETYGTIIRNKSNTTSVGYITDTKFFEKLIKAYSNVKVLIMNVTLKDPRPNIPHLSTVDAKMLIEGIKPEVAIMTHFGRTMVYAKPWEIAENLTDETGIRTIAAWDNMIFDLETLKPVKQR
ncbi:MBL fold metallo-hydrolase [Desulfurobacterium indicum]|uniref:MBL fold metallo-hydrolase n=1 Tax=Desulfurobacterium indicum TaxID=1914305 RepID=A0A1R1MMC4_9BACT|nr:MBL fold metallo-hydrolase [Desulfurobacterium indicum]OMH40927.1 MBL fold metallo-hydrolase [Desulfurobacterium indicum]